MATRKSVRGAAAPRARSYSWPKKFVAWKRFALEVGLPRVFPVRHVHSFTDHCRHDGIMMIARGFWKMTRTSCHMILCGATQYSSDGTPTKQTATLTTHPTWLQTKTGFNVQMKKLVHRLFGQHSLRYVSRNEVDMSPAQIFTNGGQHPLVSRILVLSLNAHSHEKNDLPSLRTRSETADAFQAEENVEACEFTDVVGVLQTCSCCSEKKKTLLSLP